MAAAFALREIFPVQTLLQLLLGGLPHREHLAGEMHGLVGHRMVEVHHHGLVLDFHHLAVDHLSHAVEHRQEPSEHQQVLAQLPVHLEGALRDFDPLLLVIDPVAVLRRHLEVKLIAGLPVQDLLLENREQHMGSVYIFQRLL